MQQPDLSTEAAQRVWSKLLADEQAAIDAEQAAAQRQAALAAAQREAQQGAAYSRMIETFKTLKPLYTRRDEVARALVLNEGAASLTDFITLEREISGIEFRAQAGVMVGTDGGAIVDMVSRARSAADIPGRHDALGLTASDEAQRIALTTLRCLMAGIIGEGGAAIGQSSIRFW